MEPQGFNVDDNEMFYINTSSLQADTRPSLVVSDSQMVYKILSPGGQTKFITVNAPKASSSNTTLVTDSPGTVKIIPSPISSPIITPQVKIKPKIVTIPANLSGPVKAVIPSSTGKDQTKSPGSVLMRKIIQIKKPLAESPSPEMKQTGGQNVQVLVKKKDGSTVLCQTRPHHVAPGVSSGPKLISIPSTKTIPNVLSKTSSAKTTVSMSSASSIPLISISEPAAAPPISIQQAAPITALSGYQFTRLPARTPVQLRMPARPIGSGGSLLRISGSGSQAIKVIKSGPSLVRGLTTGTRAVVQPLKGFTIPGKSRAAPIVLSSPEDGKDTKLTSPEVGEEIYSIESSDVVIVNQELDEDATSSEVVEVSVPLEVLNNTGTNDTEEELQTIINGALIRVTDLLQSMTLNLSSAQEELASLLQNVSRTSQGLTVLKDKAFLNSLKRNLQGTGLQQQLAWLIYNMNVICANLKLAHVPSRHYGSIPRLHSVMPLPEKKLRLGLWSKEMQALCNLCSTIGNNVQETKVLRSNLQACFVKVTNFMRSSMDEMKQEIQKFGTLIRTTFQINLVKKLTDSYAEKELYRMFLTVNKTKGKIERVYREIMRKTLTPEDEQKIQDSLVSFHVLPASTNDEFDLLCDELEQSTTPSKTEEADLMEDSPDKIEASFSDSLSEFVVSCEEEDGETQEASEGAEKRQDKISTTDFEHFFQKYRTDVEVVAEETEVDTEDGEDSMPQSSKAVEKAEGNKIAMSDFEQFVEQYRRQSGDLELEDEDASSPELQTLQQELESENFLAGRDSSLDIMINLDSMSVDMNHEQLMQQGTNSNVQSKTTEDAADSGSLQCTLQDIDVDSQVTTTMSDPLADVKCVHLDVEIKNESLEDSSAAVSITSEPNQAVGSNNTTEQSNHHTPVVKSESQIDSQAINTTSSNVKNSTNELIKSEPVTGSISEPIDTISENTTTTSQASKVDGNNTASITVQASDKETCKKQIIPSVLSQCFIPAPQKSIFTQKDSSKPAEHVATQQGANASSTSQQNVKAAAPTFQQSSILKTSLTVHKSASSSDPISPSVTSSATSKMLVNITPPASNASNHVSSDAKVISSDTATTTEPSSTDHSPPPAKKMFEELKKYTRELFTREQESLNSMLNRSGKLGGKTSANIGPRASKTETDPKTNEDEVMIIDDKEVESSGDVLKAGNVQKFNDLSCCEVFLDESSNQKSSKITEGNLINIFDLAKKVKEHDESVDVTNESDTPESPKTFTINKVNLLTKKFQAMTERKRSHDEVEMLQPHENLDDPEVKRRVKIYKERWITQQRDQALESACLKGMKAQMGLRNRPGQESPDLQVSGPEDTSGEEVKVLTVRPNRDNRKTIRPLSQGEVMGNPLDKVYTDKVGNRVYRETDFYPCCFKLKTKVACTCGIYAQNQNQDNQKSQKRKRESDPPAPIPPPEKKRKNKSKPSQDQDRIYRCVSCGCYGDLNDFISVEFCSVECRDIQEASRVNLETLGVLRSPGKGNKLLDSADSNVDLTKSPRKLRPPESEIDLTKSPKKKSTNESQPSTYSAAVARWSWKDYYSATNSRPAPLRAFRNEPPSKQHTNRFQLGHKLEAKDPQMESRICVVTVVEIKGPRIRCHFDGYPDRYDFWVNANSPDLYPAGWNAQFHRRILPPCKAKYFSWSKYLRSTHATAAPLNCFMCTHMPPSVFKINHKLEAINKKSTNMFHVATVKDVIGPRVHVHFDGLHERLDYWTDIGTAYISPVGWCKRNNMKLVPPPTAPTADNRILFNWDSYLFQTNALPVPEEGFVQIPMLNSFERGQKVEAVDPRVPSLVRVATVKEVDEYRIKLSLDGFDSYCDYWIYYDSVNVHPPGWCKRTGHPLEPPVGSLIPAGDCGTTGCTARGHTKWQSFEFHYTAETCPYNRANITASQLVVWSRLDNEKIESVIAPMGERPRLADYALIEDIDIGSPCMPDEDSGGLTSSQVSQASSRRTSASDEESDLDEEVNVETIERENGAKKLRRSLQKGSQSQMPYNINFLPLDKKTRARVDKLREAVIRSVYDWPPEPQDLATMFYWRRNLDRVKSSFNLDEKGDPATWSETDVQEFVSSLPGCKPYVRNFENQRLDGVAFLLLSRSDLTRYLHLKLGPAAKIFGAIVELRKRTTRMHDMLFAPLRKPTLGEVDSSIEIDVMDSVKIKVEPQHPMSQEENVGKGSQDSKETEEVEIKEEDNEEVDRGDTLDEQTDGASENVADETVDETNEETSGNIVNANECDKNERIDDDLDSVQKDILHAHVDPVDTIDEEAVDVEGEMTDNTVNTPDERSELEKVLLGI